MTNIKPNKVHRNPKKRVAEQVNTYRALRTLQIAGEKRWPGELVPEAHTWLRVSNYTHTGYLEEVRVAESDFDEAVSKYCPDLAESLAEKAKGAPVADKDDNKFTGFVFNEDAQVVDVAAQRALARQRKLAETPASDRPASFDAAGTPEYMEQNTPDHVHSDGGSTVWSEKNFPKDVEKALAPNDGRPAEENELRETDPNEDLSSGKGPVRNDEAKGSDKVDAPNTESRSNRASTAPRGSDEKRTNAGDVKPASK